MKKSPTAGGGCSTSQSTLLSENMETALAGDDDHRFIPDPKLHPLFVWARASII